MMNIRLLRADEIDVRVGGFNKEKTGGFLLLYKDARVDMAVLDDTFGVYGWKRKHELINGKLFCTISIYDKENNQWIDKQDVGVESNNDATKGEASDSFKRAGFNVGIGRELYTAPFIWINGLGKYDKFKVSEIGYNENREINKLIIVDDKGKQVFKLGEYTKPKEPAKISQTKADQDLLEKMYELVKVKKKTEEVIDYIHKEFGKSNSKDMTEPEVKKTIEWLKSE
jgi:hypothetical protein